MFMREDCIRGSRVVKNDDMRVTIPSIAMFMQDLSDKDRADLALYNLEKLFSEYDVVCKAKYEEAGEVDAYNKAGSYVDYSGIGKKGNVWFGIMSVDEIARHSGCWYEAVVEHMHNKRSVKFENEYNRSTVSRIKEMIYDATCGCEDSDDSEFLLPVCVASISRFMELTFGHGWLEEMEEKIDIKEFFKRYDRLWFEKVEEIHEQDALMRVGSFYEYAIRHGNLEDILRDYSLNELDSMSGDYYNMIKGKMSEKGAECFTFSDVSDYVVAEEIRRAIVKNTDSASDDTKTSATISIEKSSDDVNGGGISIVISGDVTININSDISPEFIEKLLSVVAIQKK